MVLKKRIVSENALSSGRKVSLEFSCFVLYWVALGATETPSLEVVFFLFSSLFQEVIHLSILFL